MGPPVKVLRVKESLAKRRPLAHIPPQVNRSLAPLPPQVNSILASSADAATTF